MELSDSNRKLSASPDSWSSARSSRGSYRGAADAFKPSATNTAAEINNNDKIVSAGTLPGGTVNYCNSFPLLHKLGELCRGSKIQFLTFVCVMWALFAQDVCFGWVEKSR